MHWEKLAACSRCHFKSHFSQQQQRKIKSISFQIISLHFPCPTTQNQNSSRWHNQFRFPQSVNTWSKSKGPAIHHHHCSQSAHGILTQSNIYRSMQRAKTQRGYFYYLLINWNILVNSLFLMSSLARELMYAVSFNSYRVVLHNVLSMCTPRSHCVRAFNAQTTENRERTRTKAANQLTLRKQSNECIITIINNFHIHIETIYNKVDCWHAEFPGPQHRRQHGQPQQSFSSFDEYEKKKKNSNRK